MSFDPARGAVAVLGARQGSGVFLGTAVLTCSHVLGDNPRTPVQVAHPHHREARRYTVAWRNSELDAALLIPDLSPHADWYHAPRPGSTDTPAALPGCEIVGFPDVQRYDGGKLDTDHYTGTVLPLAGLIRRELTFEFDRPPAEDRPDGPSPLAGLSGAPVFAGGSLLGIVRSVRTGRGLRRVTCVPLALLAETASFREKYLLLDQTQLLRLESITGAHSADPPYEREYALALRSAYRKTKIFGLDELGRPDAEWDLDTAYLSLEAHSTEGAVGRAGSGERETGALAPDTPDGEAVASTPHTPDREALTPTPHTPDRGTAAAAPHTPDRGTATAIPHTPQRIDTLLTSRPRVLLRGDAGAGKTTLVWWLAAHAAAGTLGPRLAALNGLVPYVVPLRTLRAQSRAFPAPDQLPTASRLMVDKAPDGWAGRVLKAGRALILVDGLDEVSQDDREDAHAWLSELLARYPDNRCIVTSRPLAVGPGWLGSEGFEELRLLPMRNGDIQSFVAAWHRAARLSSADPHEELPDLERDLALQFRRSPALADLARTPLLCAVICAVHRVRQGFLPETRWALYQSALHMLLGNRDKRRKIGAPEGIDMTIEEHTQLLQRIAIWQVRGGQTEFTRLQAVRQLQPALAGMERVRSQGSSDAILTHLVNRTGLLQERTDDFFQFTHRTFQDFLAAREFVEGDHLAELLKHADNPQWEDVVLLAAGHCNRRELQRLLTGLLEKGTRPVLTALCAQHASWLDETLARHIRNQVLMAVPPTGLEHAAQLARLGTPVVALLPAPEALSPTQAHYTVRMLGRIGGTEALGYVAALARHADEEIAQALADAWPSFPVAAYARDVLARLASWPHDVTVSTSEQLAQLLVLPELHDVVSLSGTYADQDLPTLLAAIRRRQD